MTQEWTVPAWALLGALGALLLMAAVAVLALWSARTARAATTRELAAVLERLERLERPPATARPRAETEFVITHLGDKPEPAAEPAPVVEASLFADLVLRESVVQAASFAQGLRRALAPETRHRIRFEMRRELKRARRQRRADGREAKR
ncbi:MAG: hypothetical protein F2667_11160, partial [Actinobacteria bacterium]|nr:hypothetical protein [Actinomycetota bacterium]